jgi:hypothetical protein
MIAISPMTASPLYRMFLYPKASQDSRWQPPSQPQATPAKYVCQKSFGSWMFCAFSPVK